MVTIVPGGPDVIDSVTLVTFAEDAGKAGKSNADITIRNANSTANNVLDNLTSYLFIITSVRNLPKIPILNITFFRDLCEIIYLMNYNSQLLQQNQIIESAG